MALPEENNVTMIDDINPYDIVSKPQNVNQFNLGLTIPKTNLGLTQNFNLPFNQFMQTYRSTNVQPPQSTIYTPKTFDQETRFREMYGTMGDKKDRKKFNKYWKSDQRWEDYDKFASEEHSKFMQSIDDTLARLKQESQQAVKNTVNSYKPFEQTVTQPVVDFNNVQSVQNWLNTKFNSGLTADNMYGQNTNNAITTALQRTDLTDVERQGLTSLQNSWKDRMIGQKDLAPKNFGRYNVDDFDQLFAGKQYQKINLKDGTHAYKDTNNGNYYYNNGRMKFKNGAMGFYSKEHPDQPENKYDYEYREKGYTPERLKDGSYQYVDPQSNFTFYNNGRFVDSGGNKGTVLDNGNLLYDRKKQGGLINKHQQGGTMANNEQELQKAFMAFLIEDAAAQGMQIQSEEDLKAYAQQLGKEGLQAKYQEFMQKMQGGVKAKLGTKLDYIRKIKGLCQEDEELVYMKKGGRVCPVCEKKKKAMKAKEGEKLDAVKEFKCGRKIKKAGSGTDLENNQKLEADTLQRWDGEQEITRAGGVTKSSDEGGITLTKGKQTAGRTHSGAVIGNSKVLKVLENAYQKGLKPAKNK